MNTDIRYGSPAPLTSWTIRPLHIALAVAPLLLLCAHPAGAQNSGRKSSRDIAPAIYAPTSIEQATPESSSTPPTPPQQPSAATASEDPSVQVSIPYDYNAFCNSPSSDGQPRSPLWVQNCMDAGADHQNAADDAKTAKNAETAR